MGKYKKTTEVIQYTISMLIKQQPSDLDRVTEKKMMKNNQCCLMECTLLTICFSLLLRRTNNSPVLDSMSYCTIELSIGLVLYLKDINPTTALICILKKESRINEGN